MSDQRLSLLLSIHGIRSLGQWQDELEPELSGSGWRHVPFKYGFLDLPRFLRRKPRERIIEKFRDWYMLHADFDTNKNPVSGELPSIVAHSFGAYVVGWSMVKYSDIKFDKVILCGSILPQDFDWITLLGRNQIRRLKNEYGLADRWAKIAAYFVPGTGASGAYGFNEKITSLRQERFPYHRHSNYFRIGHCRNFWLPFLSEESLQAGIRHGRDIRKNDTFLTMLNFAHEIDTACYQGLKGYKRTEVPRGRSATWIQVEPDIYTFLINIPNERVLGYINAMPLRNDAFKKVLEGKLVDNKVTSADLLPFNCGQELPLYLMSIAISPAARRFGEGLYSESFEKLLASVEEKLLYYFHEYDTRIREVIAVGWTTPGQKICEALGLRLVGKDPFKHPIYWQSVKNAEKGNGPLGRFLFRLKEKYERGRYAP